MLCVFVQTSSKASKQREVWNLSHMISHPSPLPPHRQKKKIYKIDRGAPILQRKKAFSSPHCNDGFSLVVTFVRGRLAEPRLYNKLQS